MLFGKRSSTHYYGSETYRYMDKLLGQRGDLLLVSPYIDPYYAKQLVSASHRRKIYLVSSSPDPEAVKLIKGRVSLWIIAYFAVSFVILYLLLLIGVRNLYLLISFIPFAFGLYQSFMKMSRIKFKTPRRFIHAKIYISESMAISGSANLTYKGMHKNLEQVEIIYDKEEISRLKKQFWEIWNRYQ